MNWEEIGNAITNFFKTSGVDILKAIAIFFVGVLVIKVLLSFVKNIFKNSKMEKATQGFLIQVIRIVLYLLLMFVLASVLGINTTGLLAVVSTAGLALSLALQSSLSNLANGVVLIATHPFREGDYVAINSIEGTVKALQLTHTILVTPDNKIINIPNSNVISNEIINFNTLGTRRISYDLNFDNQFDIEKIKKAIFNTLKTNNKIKKTPNMTIDVSAINENLVTLTTKFWVDSKDYWDIYYDMLENILYNLKQNDIKLAHNQMEILLKK